MTQEEKWDELKRFIMTVVIRERRNKEVGEWIYSREILVKLSDLEDMEKEKYED